MNRGQIFIADAPIDAGAVALAKITYECSDCHQERRLSVPKGREARCSCPCGLVMIFSLGSHPNEKGLLPLSYRPE